MLTVTGTVVTGLGLGRELGWPTANISYPPHVQLPPAGVYAGYVEIGTQHFLAAIAIGARPQSPALLEVHVIDFNDDLHGEHITIHIGDQVSTMQQLQTTEELKQKISSDVAAVKKLLT